MGGVQGGGGLAVGGSKGGWGWAGGRGVQKGGWGGGLVVGGSKRGGGGVWGDPHLSGDPELLEAPKAFEQIFWPKLTCAKGARENFDWLKTRRNLCPITQEGGGSEGGGWGVSDPPELLSKTLAATAGLRHHSDGNRVSTTFVAGICRPQPRPQQWAITFGPLSSASSAWSFRTTGWRTEWEGVCTGLAVPVAKVALRCRRCVLRRWKFTFLEGLPLMISLTCSWMSPIASSNICSWVSTLVVSFDTFRHKSAQLGPQG